MPFCYVTCNKRSNAYVSLALPELGVIWTYSWDHAEWGRLSFCLDHNSFIIKPWCCVLVSLFFRREAADQAFDFFGLIRQNILNLPNSLGHFLLSPNMLYPFFLFDYTNQKEGRNCPDIQSLKSEPASQTVPWTPALAPSSFFLSLLAGGSRKVVLSEAGPQGSLWDRQCWATAFPLPCLPPVWLWWL